MNSGTKDNISNVYGAKTIPALIPLNLEFEMEPSNKPGMTQSVRNWSTQEDSGSRTITILGHISRPVVGEGRQTPDRQMFFVNARPCNLPQVAKAVNEVYKSFNITQSPFIFADIKLDTNAYDVNVSPDKRTIMLHDQTTLLENLKEALATMFETHDQSVPQAQLLGKSMAASAFRTPFLKKQNSTISHVDEESSGSESANGTCTQPSRSLGVSSLLETQTKKTHPGFVKASLIERFASQDIEGRDLVQAASGREASPPEINENIIERAPSLLAQRPAVPPKASHAADESEARMQSPIFEPEEIEVDPPVQLQPPSKAVQDFNARIASQTAQQPQRNQRSQALEVDSDEDGSEPSIPGVQPSSRKSLTQSTIQNAFDRMRPMRTPTQQATITIGDTTTVSMVGTGSQIASSRKSRIHTPRFSLSGKPLDLAPRTSLFKKGLSSFAAPGTQVQVSDGEGETDESDQENEAIRVAARSPSPQKRLPASVSKEAQIGDAIARSNTPPSSPRLEQDDIVDDDERPSAEVQSRSDESGSDNEYVDESEKKAREEAKIAQMIIAAEEAAARPTELNLKRANKLFRVTNKKNWTINLERVIQTEVETIAGLIKSLGAAAELRDQVVETAAILPVSAQLGREDPEERLSLTVTKRDFNEMRIIGQFNLGFIIAVRPPTSTSPTSDLFIIDQHASDEKYNFERFSATTTLVSQRLVHPHPLELTAVEEEIILGNEHSLTANGFVVEIETSDEHEAGRRAKLISLPMSREVTFTPKDLEELLALIMDNPPSSSTTVSSHIPRPSKVRKLLASRACRSSVMIGKTLQQPRMKEIVRHMGSMDKPWSCPHGRPTMRHLYGLEQWTGWTEGDGVTGVEFPGEQKTDWNAFLRCRKAKV